MPPQDYTMSHASHFTTPSPKMEGSFLARAHVAGWAAVADSAAAAADWAVVGRYC